MLVDSPRSFLTPDKTPAGGTAAAWGCGSASASRSRELSAALAGTLLQANAASPSCISPSEGDVGEEQDQVAGSLKPLWERE